MRARTLLPIMVATVSLAGCSEKLVRRYDQAQVQWDEPRYEWQSPRFEAAPGQGVVLSLHEFGGVPIPDAMGGYRLLLETDSERVRAGAVFTVPSEELIGYLNILGLTETSSDEVSGRVEILKLNGSDVLAELDLREPELEWQYEGTVRFRTVSLQFYGKSDWWVWTRGGGSWYSYVIAVVLAVCGFVATGFLFLSRDARLKNRLRPLVLAEMALVVFLFVWQVLGADAIVLYPLALVLVGVTVLICRCFKSSPQRPNT